jgi:hypothetical protein
MSADKQFPNVRRRIVTLDASQVIHEVPSKSEIRIVRHQPARLDNLHHLPPPTQTDSHTVAFQNKTLVREGGTVLVINASLEMARELTVELTNTIPGCNILFAPTLSTALWILKRRCIDIILSSSVLPDGPLSRLHEFLEQMTPPPELVVLSELGTTRSHMDSHPGYRFVELRRLALLKTPEAEPREESEKISALGADLRNDLNNPLQEIVAMAFVAQASQGLSPVAEKALSAIERAAGSMATVVEGLEEKIRGAVERSAA